MIDKGTRSGEVDDLHEWAEDALQAEEPGAGEAFSPRQEEAALKREDVFTSAIIDGIPALLYLYDDQCKLIRWNKQHEKFTGYTSEELAGMHFLDWFRGDEEEIALIARMIEQCFAEKFAEAEAHLRTKSGEKKIFHFTAVRLEIDGKGYLAGIGVDIAERRRGEETLHLKQALLRTVLDLVPDHIYVKDVESRFLLANISVARAMGVANPEELIGKFDKEFYPQEEADEFRSDEKDVLNGHSMFDKEEPLTHPDGTRRFILTTKVPLKDADGNIVGVVGIGRDITERKQAELAVRESEERYRLLAENTTDVIWVVDAESETYRYISPSVERLRGYTVEEVMAQGPTSAIAPASLQYLRSVNPGRHERFRQGYNEFFTDEVELLHKDGHTVWTEVTSRFTRNRITGHIEGTGVTRDISERKRAEAELQRQHDLLRTLIDHLPDYIYVKDLEGRFLVANRAVAQIMGTEPEMLMGRFDADFYPHEKSAEFQDDEARVFSGESLVNKYEPHVDQQGRRREILTTKLPLHDRVGKIIGLIGFGHDITERKRVEEDIKQAKEAAEAANRAKDQFIAILSHELRTPLTPVLVTVSALQKHQDLTVDLRSDMELVRRNVEMEAALIDDLLDVTRISQGKIVLQQETMDVHNCLRTALEICEAEIIEKSLVIQSEFLAVQHHVWGDPARLRQVFWNLLKNAVKFTPDGGRITIQTRTVGDRLQIEIADTGIGIDPEVLPRIFNLFEQGEQNKARQFGGLGLGLNIARAVVELHEGRLTAASEGRNKGATFTVELDTVPQHEKLEPPTPSVETEKRPLRILLVEDHLDTLYSLVKLLKKWGHAVTAAENVRKALELVDGQEFDLLISDMGLPDGSGLDVMRRIKERSGIPGIALSGFGTEDDIRQSRSAGFAEHLVKPVNINALQKAIQRVAGL